MRPIKLSQAVVSEASNTLVLGYPGSGKTYQAIYYHKVFGRGLIVSMEAGLKSLPIDDNMAIDVWPIKTYADFLQVRDWILSPDFQKEEYKWVMVDSITELSDQIMLDIERNSKSNNGFEKWGFYKERMLEQMKFNRDLNCHTIVTSLATKKEVNGSVNIIPLIAGGSVAEQIPGIFDNVFGLEVYTGTDPETKQTIQKRRIVAGAWNNWNVCKVRDANQICPVVIEDYSNIPAIIKRIANGKPKAKPANQQVKSVGAETIVSTESSTETETGNAEISNP